MKKDTFALVIGAMLILSTDCRAETIKLDCSMAGDKTIVKIDLSNKQVEMQSTTSVCHMKFDYVDGYSGPPKKEVGTCIDMMSEGKPTMNQSVIIDDESIKFGNNNHLLSIDRIVGDVTG